MGIKEEDKHLLFSMFGKLQANHNINVHGVGFGLTICKKLVEEMEGKIGFNSVYEKGTTFWFTLPLNKV